MTRPRVIILTLTALFAAGVTTYLCLPKQPRYQGRTLAQWIEQANGAGENSPNDLESDPRWQSATNALRQMAPEAIPWLLKWGSATDSRARMIVIAMLNSLSSPRFHIDSAQDRRETAYLGFALLDRAAKPAWPTLVQWTSDPNPDRRISGARCLADSRADADIIKPVLLCLMKDADLRVQREALRMFRIRFRKDANDMGLNSQFLPAKPPGPATAAETNSFPNK